MTDGNNKEARGKKKENRTANKPDARVQVSRGNMKESN